jgi:hypothetical protein
MNRTRRLTSILIVCHLSATIIGAIPAPKKLPKFDRLIDPNRNVLSGTFTPTLDRLVDNMAAVHGWTWRSFSPAIELASHYLSALGLGQSWAMFSVPPQTDSYVRLRYFISDGAGEQIRWVATELLMPDAPEDRVRWFASYRGSFRDKAFETSLGSFREHRKETRANLTSSELPDDLRPFTRYFGRHFAEAHLLPTERIVRTELWLGTAPNNPPGSGNVAGTPPERLQILSAYYSGPIEDRSPNPPLPPYHASQHEGDIAWILEFFE